MTLLSCNKKCCDSDLCNAPSNDEMTPGNLVPFTTGGDDFDDIFSENAQTTVETRLGMY